MIERETLSWDTTKSYNLAFLKYYPALVDRAILIEQASSIDGNGVAFDIMSAADFFAWFGTHPQPRQPMGPAAGNAAALINWTKNHDLRTDQLKGKATLRKLVLDTVPKELLIPMQDVNRSLRLRSTEHIVSTLKEQLGALSKADIDSLMRELSEPYHPGTCISSFVTNWQASLRDLTRAGQPLPHIMAIDMFQKCFSSVFIDCWVLFVQKYPNLVDRTIDRLGAAIIVFAKDSLPILNAQLAIKINVVQSRNALLTDMQDKLSVLERTLPPELKSAVDEPKQATPNQNKRGRRLSSFKIFQAKQIARGLSAPLQPSKTRGTKQPDPVLANADSGATGNYLALADISVLRDVRISSVSEQISVSVANGTQLRSTHHGYLDVPEHGAMLAHIFHN